MGKAFSIVERSHVEAKKFFGPRAIDCAVDATLGGGGDALFLASLLSEGGRIFGFDVQEEAVARSRALFEKNGLLGKCTLFCSGHENMSELIPQKYRGRVGGVFFNLGWLPRSDKACVTKPETTVAALEAAVGLIDKSFGYLSIASYRGHAGGEEECEAVRKFFSKIKNVRAEEMASSDDPKSPVLFTAKFVI